MAKLFATSSKEWEAYPENMPSLREQLGLRLSTKAEFMSPGTIWASLPLDPTNLVWAAVIYIMLFGGDVKFFKADGLIDTHTRQKIWDLVFKLFKSHDVEKLKQTLKADIPRIDTSALELPEQKAKRSRKKSVVVPTNGDGNK